MLEQHNNPTEVMAPVFHSTALEVPIGIAINEAYTEKEEKPTRPSTVVSDTGHSHPQREPRAWGGVKRGAEMDGPHTRWSESETALCLSGTRQSLKSFQVIEG